MLPKIILFDIGASGKPNANIKKMQSLSIVDCDIFLVEPSSHLLTDQLHGSFFIKAAIGKENGEAILYDPEVGGASLFQRDNDIVFRYVSSKAFDRHVLQEKVKITTFSNIADKYSIRSVDAFKIDTQGSELEILESIDTAGLIDTCFLVEVEIPSMPTSYLNQPKMSEVIGFFEEKGFWLGKIYGNYAYDISHQAYLSKHSKIKASILRAGSAKKAMDIDCIFFASPLKVLKTQDSDTIVRYALVLVAWGFYLEAISVIGEARAKKIVSSLEQEKFLQVISECVNFKDPTLFARLFGAKIIYLARRIRDKYKKVTQSQPKDPANSR